MHPQAAPVCFRRACGVVRDAADHPDRPNHSRGAWSSRIGSSTTGAC
jgi:hypothetical protein